MNKNSLDLINEFAHQYQKEHPEYTLKQIGEAINGYWYFMKQTFLDDDLHQTRMQFLGSFMPHKSASKLLTDMRKITNEKYPYLLEYHSYKLDTILNRPQDFKTLLSYKEYVQQLEKDKSDS